VISEKEGAPAEQEAVSCGAAKGSAQGHAPGM